MRPPMTFENDQNDFEIDLRACLESFWNKRLLFLKIFFVVNLIVFILASLIRSQYKSEATILVTSVQSTLGGRVVLPGVLGTGLDPTRPSVDQFIAIAQSRLVAKDVITKIGLPIFAKDFGLEPDEKTNQIDINKAAEGLRGEVVVQATKQYVSFEVHAYSADMALLLAQTYMDAIGSFLNEASLSFNFRLLDEPLLPEYRFFPSRLKFLILSSFFVFCGFFVYLVIEQTRKQSFKDIKTNIQ